MVKFSFINAVDPTTIIFMVMLGLLIVALLVVPFFTNKKRAKQTDELHRSLQPGDLVKTIGGVIGTIIEIREISPVDKEMVIETGVGDNKTTMTFDIQALYQVMSRSSTIVPVEEPKREEEPHEEPAPVVAPIEEQPVPAVEETKPVEEAQPVAEEPTSNAEQPAEEPAVVEQAATEEPTSDATPKATAPKKKPANSGAKKSSGTKSSSAKSAGAKTQNKK